MHLGSRSDSFRKNRETSPVQVLGATGCANPCTVDARPSLHFHKDNLGKMRVACLDKRSHKSLHRASLAQKRVGSLPELLPPKHFAFEEQTRQLLEHVPPSLQLFQEIAQLRAEVHAVRFLVQKLVAKDTAKEESFKNKLGAKGAHNTNKNDNNNNKNNNNNNSTNNIACQESSFNSKDLDNDNPESDLSGSDLDESSLGSFTPEGLVESSFSSQDHKKQPPASTTII